jgi:hypothetical protein
MIRGAAVVLGLLAVAAPTSAQGVYIGSEPTMCPSPFRPFSGLTFHEDEAWRVTWSTSPYQLGRAFYRGSPDPVLSQDGTALWWNPSVLAECINHWYQQPNGSNYVIFDWHALSYQGRVVSENCGLGDGDEPIYITSYDPYSPYGPEGENETATDCEDDGLGGGGDGDGGEEISCHWEWVVVEASTDGGATWFEWWSGWATVCEYDAA